ncbi:Nudix hydrolase 15, mitochondrial [Entomortierella beljakovae]|nr:Nudix hydrolase 15, mitochondrial [Entomortierella beljakovae]
MTNPEKIVQVGVGVWIMHDKKVLIGKRIGSHESGTWQLAGGHLEFGESFEECATRESLEETDLNLDPKSLRFVTANNNLMPDFDKHYVTVFMAANVVGNSLPKVMEPLKCEKWEWISKEQLLDDNGPYRPLLSPLARMIKNNDVSHLFA